MRILKTALLSLLSTAAVCTGELLVYEPFDYQPINHEVMGRLDGRNGGLGFSAPWKDTASEVGHAFIYDKRGNPADLYGGAWGGGKPNWDGVVDNLPTMGGYVGNSDWNIGGDRLNSTRKLARSAGAMAKESGGVLWVSAVWHLPAQQFFAPVGIALASDDSGFKERVVALNGKTNAIGVGNGKNFRARKTLNPMVWANGEEVAGESGTKIDATRDNIVIIKFEFGETDKVSTWYFTEDQKMTEDAFNQNAISATSPIDEDTLNYLTVGTILADSAIDEIRMGTSFQSVISGSIPARQEVKIAKTLYDEKSDSYSLEWSSNPGETYGIYVAEDVGGYKPCVAAAVEAAADKKTTTFGPFPSPRKGEAKLQFELGLPDTTPPQLDRVWGGGSSISLVFSEPLLPTTALAAQNYTVVQDGGQELGVKSAIFDPASGAVTLTTEKPLKPASSFTVTTRNLTDHANHPLAAEKITFKTWDDDPKGIKVFILAGQSNMVGYGHSEIGAEGVAGGAGTLRYLAVNNEKYPEYDYRSLLVDPTQPATSAWKTRSDVKVWWKNGASANMGGPLGKGDLGPPFRGANEKWFGPEYGFGQVVGDYYTNDDVLLIKAAWGGRNLVSEFRSPYAVAARGGEIGAFYKGMFDDVREVLDNLGKEFPEWSGRGYQIVGFAWHQGTSDKAPPLVAEEYKYNMPDLIRSVRAETGKPNLPFVIATTGMGYGGPASNPPYENYHPVEKAQLWVAGVEKPANVLTDDTRKYYEKPEDSPRNQGFHWNQNARCYFRVGYGLGNDMVKLLESASK